MDTGYRQEFQDGNVFERWDDPAAREAILFAARAIETEPSLLGASPHLLMVAQRP
ncbi:MAG: hypothetical protein R2761_19755 [Acidimicrobiales bacterium]